MLASRRDAPAALEKWGDDPSVTRPKGSERRRFGALGVACVSRVAGMAENGAAMYRLNAAQCVEFAQGLSDVASKAKLLTMAQYWMTLADQAEKNHVVQQQQQPQFTPAPEPC